MAVVKIEEPNVEGANLEDWSKFIYRTTMQGGGFMALMLGNVETIDQPFIAKGSRLEVNHSFYIAIEDEEIELPSNGLISGTTYYIYAIPQTDALSFQFLPQVPAYNSLLGGWFSGNMRAIGRTFYHNNNWYNTVVLDSVDSFNRQNWDAGFPSMTGTTIANGVLGAFSYFNAKPGLYRIELLGGKGGNGAAAIATQITFVLDKLTSIGLMTGRNGNVGATGVNGRNGIAQTIGSQGSGTPGGASGGKGGTGGGQAGFDSVAVIPGIGEFKSLGSPGAKGEDGAPGEDSSNGRQYGTGGRAGSGGNGGQINGAPGFPGESGGDAAEGNGGNSGHYSGTGGIGGTGGSGLSNTSSGYARLILIVG